MSDKTELQIVTDQRDTAADYADLLSMAIIGLDEFTRLRNQEGAVGKHLVWNAAVSKSERLRNSYAKGIDEGKR